MKKKTEALRKKVGDRTACRPGHTVETFNDLMALFSDARAEAAEMRQAYREAELEEDPRALAALNELREKLRALDYHLPKAEEAVERLQGILLWFDRHADAVFERAQKRLEDGGV